METPIHYSYIKTGRSSLYDWLNKNYPDFLTYILQNYPDIDLKIAIYMYYNDIKDIPVCVCGKPVKFHGYKYGFAKFCSPSCASSDKEVQAKLKKTITDKYGDDYMIDRIKKLKITKLKKYGDPNYNNIKKAKQTCLKKYGVSNPMQNEGIQYKSKQTCLEKYGNIYFLKSEQYKDIRDSCIEKAKQTCLEKYGGLNPMNDENIKNKVKQTCLEKYGVEWNCLRSEAKNSRNNDSGPNIEFKSLLDSYNIQYEREYYIDGKLFDFKVGNTLIEINPSATHNTTWNPFGGKVMSKNYHIHKTNLARSNNYNIINVWDWDDKNKIIFLLTDKNTIYARKCSIKEVSVKDTNNFLKKYHLQNSCKNQKVRIGLYYYNELVSIMTFGKPRYSKKYEWELLRLCYNDKYNIVGGSKKMFSYFIKHYNPTNIVSYCDNSKFDGKVYYKLGFIKNNTFAPSRHWYNCKTNIHITDNLLRQKGVDQLLKTNYGKGSNNELLMKEHNFVEIYDAGQISWFWQKNL